MKIAVLFDGAGLARLGLEMAGHECTGVELDPWKHHLSQQVGSGNSVLCDAREFDLTGYDAVWASPPCQNHSLAKTQGPAKSVRYADKDLFEWSLALAAPILWVENVIAPTTQHRGPHYNAAQFIDPPIQNRNRVVCGRYVVPALPPYRRAVPGICPCVTATEYRGCASDTRRASRFYGRKLTVEECAYHQGFDVPKSWWIPPSAWTGTRVGWRNQLYEAIGNGVPVYMAKAFGDMHAVG